MQYLGIPFGPSSKTCPKCESQSEHLTSVLIIPWDESLYSTMHVSSIGWKKLGHPQPELYFVEEEKSSFLQQS